MRLPGRPASKNLAGIVRPNPVLTPEPNKLLTQALNHPLDGFSLDRYLKSAPGVLLVINDATRPTPSSRLLDHLLPRLDGRQLEILVATGTHRPPSQDVLKGLLGRHYPDLVSCTMSHDCLADKDMVRIGATSRGTELVFNRRVVEAERILVLGSVEPHYYAGFTGGRKGLMPGAASRFSVESNHRFALDPRAKPLALDGNPCHEDMEEAVRLLKPDGVFGLNVVLDREGRIYFAACGELSASFRSAVEKAREVFAVSVPQPADIVVSAAAPPLDNDLYQMQKVIEHGRLALKKGGILIAVSPCHEGLGPSHYLRHLYAAAVPEEVMALTRKAYSLGDHKAVKIAEVKIAADLWAVTGLPPETLEKAFITPFADLQEAVDEALRRQGPQAKVLFLPLGSLTVPVVKNQEVDYVS
ncbi:MAG: nickel-dependent lactate racemase [Pseudomonadota bacterium]